MAIDVEQQFMDQLFDGLDADTFNQPWSSQQSVSLSPQCRIAAYPAASAPKCLSASPSRIPSKPPRAQLSPLKRRPDAIAPSPTPLRRHAGPELMSFHSPVDDDDFEDSFASVGRTACQSQHPSHCRQAHDTLNDKRINVGRIKDLISSRETLEIESPSSFSPPPPPLTKKLEDRLNLPINGWRLDDMDPAALFHRQRQRTAQRNYTRCLVVGIVERTYLSEGPSTSRPRRERLLVLHLQKKDQQLFKDRPDRRSPLASRQQQEGNEDGPTEEGPEVRLAVLRDEWLSTEVRPGDIVHLIGHFERQQMPVPSISSWTARLEERDEKRGKRRDYYAAPQIEVEYELKGAPGPSSHGSITTGDVADDDDDDDLWAEMGSLPSLSQPPPSQTLPGQLAPNMVLSSLPSTQTSSLGTHDHAAATEDGRDSRDNLLILHPDVLVPATKVSDVSSCVRKPVVQDRLRGGSDLSIPLMLGNMLHEVLQACLTGKGTPRVDAEEERALLDAIDGVRQREERERQAARREGVWDPDVKPPPPGVGPAGPGKEDGPPATIRDWPSSWTGIGNFSRPFALAQIRTQVQLNLESLFATNLDTDQAYARLEAAAAPFGHFAAVYLAQAAAGPGSGSDGFREDATILDPRSAIPARTRLTRILDVEEEVWSPMYGLKGKVDVSIEAIILETEADGGSRSGHSTDGSTAPVSALHRTASDPRFTAAASAAAKTMQGASTPFRTRSSAAAVPPDPRLHQRLSVSVMPLELKTGRATAVGLEHRAQTMLYTLMLSDRYGCDVRHGLLYYSKSGQLHRIRKSRNEVRGLIIGRNELAGYLVRRERQEGDGGEALAPLPPTIDDPHKCKRCYAVDQCMLLRRAIENVFDPASVSVDSDGEGNDKDRDIVKDGRQATAASTRIAELYAQKTSHMTQAHADFFRRWSDLLSLEEQDLVRFRRELWTMTAASREGVGRCFADMRLIAPSQQPGDGELDERPNARAMRRFTYAFRRSGEAMHMQTQAGASRPMSLLNGHISLNDPVTISIEPALLSVAQGFVTALTSDRIEVGLDHNLLPSLRRSIEEAGTVSTTSLQLDANAIASVVFRIDRDELSAGMGKVRSNLAHLFWPGEAGDTKRRELIVDLRPPRFLADTGSCGPTLPGHLNVDQQAAMRKVLSAEDYALILGMPGTGKTTTVAELIKLLVAQGKTVLLTSYTHSAVDTILRKLLVGDVKGEAASTSTSKLKILRLGNADKVHPDTRHLTLPSHFDGGVSQLEELLMTPNVVATTCLSISHVLFAKRRFDYCIVDEASQITLPTCLGPLRCADKFVLVGDHFQLPPLVRNHQARKGGEDGGGLETSLFKLLTERYEREAMVCLGRQYRMNEDVMALSNEVIYRGRLRCGSAEVARRTLRLPRRAEVVERLSSFSSSSSSCSPGVGVLPGWVSRMLDADQSVVFVDTDALPSHESSSGSLLQNTGEVRLVSLLCTLLVRCGASPCDIAAITPYRHQLKLLASSLDASIETLTADKAQGRDKDIVFLSLVRSNTFGTVGELLKDWRRLNVAVTRSRVKLVVVGSLKTLRESREVKAFLDVIEKRGWRTEVGSWSEVERVERGVEGLRSEAGGGVDVVKREEEVVLPTVDDDVKPQVETSDVKIEDESATLEQADVVKTEQAPSSRSLLPPIFSPPPPSPCLTSGATSEAPKAESRTSSRDSTVTPPAVETSHSPMPTSAVPATATATAAIPDIEFVDLRLASGPSSSPPSRSSLSLSQSRLTNFFMPSPSSSSCSSSPKGSTGEKTEKVEREGVRKRETGDARGRKKTKLSEKRLKKRGVLRDLVNGE